MVPIGVTHISCHYKNTIEGTGEKRTNGQTRTICLGLTQSARQGVMQHYISDSIYGLTLAWVTSENSTKQLECRLILNRSSSLSWTLSHAGSPLCSRCLESTASVRVPSPTANFELLFQLSSRVLFHFRSRREFKYKTLCLVSRQNRQRNRLLGGPPT